MRAIPASRFLISSPEGLDEVDAQRHCQAPLPGREGSHESQGRRTGASGINSKVIGTFDRSSCVVSPVLRDVLGASPAVRDFCVLLAPILNLLIINLGTMKEVSEYRVASVGIRKIETQNLFTFKEISA